MRLRAIVSPGKAVISRVGGGPSARDQHDDREEVLPRVRQA